ncbi:DUF5610 domain-containing protein [Herbaspirillum sp. NPDC087042]|uniref:DUF5610 domain-containing protein n=1 Tax=Herbaspirillum sp. NPDC087042 TaxID=3364004 RepID=UPI0037FDF8EF
MAIGNTSNLDSTSIYPLSSSASTDANTLSSNSTGTSAANSDKIASAQQANLLTASGSQAQLNVSILQASLQVSLNAQNDPLSLVYKSAIANISETLGISDSSGTTPATTPAAQDNSPEGTAGRIVSFITNMFQLFKQNNPDKSDSSNIDDYMNQIFKGVDQGFSEARGILDSLGALNGDIASNIDKTYSLVQKSLKDFIDQVKNGNQQGGDGSSDGSGGTVVASQTTVSISVSVSQTSISTTA